MRPSLLSIPLATIILFGLGCNSSDSPVSLDKYQSSAPEPQSSLSTPPPGDQQEQAAPQSPLPAAEQATTTAVSSVTTTTQSSNNTSTIVNQEPEKLAFPGILSASETANKLIRIKTAKGDIVFELLPQEGPKAASNFVYLVKHKFYDGLIFHRLVPGFVIQGGDPLGTGMGGPGYSFEDDEVNLPYQAGIVAMANAGSNTNGSQFFIMLEDNQLDPKYSIFGRVIQGMDVVRKIARGDVMTSVTMENKK